MKFQPLLLGFLVIFIMSLFIYVGFVKEKDKSIINEYTETIEFNYLCPSNAYCHAVDHIVEGSLNFSFSSINNGTFIYEVEI